MTDRVYVLREDLLGLAAYAQKLTADLYYSSATDGWVPVTPDGKVMWERGRRTEQEAWDWLEATLYQTRRKLIPAGWTVRRCMVRPVEGQQ